MRFHTENGRLFCERTDLQAFAERTPTPFYVYSEAALRENFLAYKTAFGPSGATICFSVKSLANLSVLKLLAGLGSGFDVVSSGEIFRVRKAGGDMSKTVFAGAGKTESEIIAGLKAGIRMFNCESVDEMTRIGRIASAMKTTAKVALRVNPDVDADTHHHITTGKKGKKFGVLIEDLMPSVARIRKTAGIDWCGLHIHIGSQILQVKPFVEAVKKCLHLIDGLKARGVVIRTMNIGGGLGIVYQPGRQKASTPTDLADAILPLVNPRGLELFLEPGRSISGDSGALVVRVQYVKKSGGKTFVITDGGMNDLIRPSLYDAYHEILPLAQRKGRFTADVVGPVCESGDFFAKDRTIPRVEEGDFLAVMNAGAYGAVMSSRYNGRPFAAEWLVADRSVRNIRKAETFEEMIRNEVLR
jgi:diaminopimelate decarboxylase